MSISPYSELTLALPTAAREELFQTGRHFPLAYLKSMVNHAEGLFSPEDTDIETREIIRAKLKLCDFIQQYGEDFFDLDSNGAAIIPDAVWEVMGARLDLISPQDWGDDYSDEAKAVIADIFKLRNDPYPKEEDYASNEGRFAYLVNIAYGSQELVRAILGGTLSDQQLDNINRQFIQPTRTIEPSSSAIEDFIIENIRMIEFIMEHEGSPYLWPVKLIRESFSGEETVYIRDMIEKAGVSDSEDVKEVFAALVSIEEQSRYLSGAEAIYTVLQYSVGPIKALKDFHGDLPEDIIIFGLIADRLDDPQKRFELTEIFGQDFVDKHMSFLSFIADSRKASEENVFDSIKGAFQQSHGIIPDSSDPASADLTPQTQGLLLDFMASRDYVEMERINLALSQDPISVPNIHEALVHMKATLLKIRNEFLRTPHPLQSTDLRDFLRDLQADTWESFDFISRIHSVGRARIEFVTSPESPS